MQTELRPVRFGYVGCGFMAQKVHLPNFSGIPGCKLLASAEVRTGQPFRSSGEDTLADVKLFEEI